MYLLEKDGKKKAIEKAKSRGPAKTSTKKWCKSAGGGHVLKNGKTVKSKSKSGGPSKRGGSGSASSNNKKWIKTAGDGRLLKSGKLISKPKSKSNQGKDWFEGCAKELGDKYEAVQETNFDNAIYNLLESCKGGLWFKCITFYDGGIPQE